MTTLILALATLAAAPADAPQPPPGFIALFNGTDLTNWNDDGKPKGHWSVKNGELHYDGKGDSLPTAKNYEDFELYVDWKIGPKGDSGIYVRGCPQVQIWDDPIGSGGLYNNQKGASKPMVVADKPVGEWNTFHITMKGEKVTVELNGKLVTDNVTLENYFDRSKPVPSTGKIELQHHGNPLVFRNIYLKTL